jgi:Zn ribbon nucleic-acid-binding protein
MAASVSTNMSFASSIDRDFDRSPSPRFWNRIDESLEASEESLSESSESSGEIGYTTEEDNINFLNHLTAAWENRNPLAPLFNDPSVRRAIVFSPHSPQINRGISRSELAPGFPPRMTEADVIVSQRAPSVSSGSEFDFPDFVRRGRPTFVDLPLFTTADPTSVFDGVDAFKINKRARSSTVASSVPPPTEIDRRIRRRVSHNALVLCTSCNGQQLVDIDDAFHVCVFCGHSTRTIDVNIRDHHDDV